MAAGKAEDSLPPLEKTTGYAMYLEHVEICGFRGINHLAISLQQVTALIGENAWGKSSLLRALWALLGQGEVPYQFTADDFHQAEPGTPCPPSRLQIVLTFCEYRSDMCLHSSRLSRLAPVWVKSRDGLHRIIYRAMATQEHSGNIHSAHHFLDHTGKEITTGVQELLHLLMLMNPVLRLRDARSTRDGAGEGEVPWESLLDDCYTPLLTSDERSSAPESLQDGVNAIHHLMEHYLNSVPPIRHKPRNVREIVSRPASLRGLGNMHTLLKGADAKSVQLAMAGLGAAMLQARGDREIDPEARPILILEDPESRLHPTMLALAWELLELLPGQKIITTNSGDLLASMPLGNIRRLVRTPGKTLCHKLHDEQLSAEELRRIAFHVRINRPMSLFARCWLLVEGETEIWLLSELASICGISFRGEGIRIIEFAQCGVAPLTKAASDLGIEWHLLADGDQAGNKYANSVRAMLKGSRESERLTLLPAKDIEHFLFQNGFAHVFRREARAEKNPWLSNSKIIERAVNRRSKPGMALAIVEDAEEGGAEAIPPLLRQMFSRILMLARTQG